MWDFGRAELLEAQAIGEPGNREFRLRVLSGNDAASLWMEKEQLAALSLAIRQLLEQTTGPEKPEQGGASSSTPFPTETQVDFKIGRLGIGYDEANQMVVIFAYTPEDAEADSPTFACQASRSQCHRFADEAEEVVSAGRPICLLCGGPIDADGHKCARRNGHSEVPIILEDEDDDS